MKSELKRFFDDFSFEFIKGRPLTYKQRKLFAKIMKETEKFLKELDKFEKESRKVKLVVKSKAKYKSDEWFYGL